MKKLATGILVGLALCTTAAAVPSTSATPAPERQGVQECIDRCNEKHTSCLRKCTGSNDTPGCARDCSSERYECEKDCDASAK